MPKFPPNQKGIAHILLIIILILGIIAGVYLVQKTQIFKPKASSQNIEWIKSDNDPDNCVTDKGATCPKVKFRINIGIDGTTGTGGSSGSNNSSGGGNNLPPAGGSIEDVGEP